MSFKIVEIVKVSILDLKVMVVSQRDKMRELYSIHGCNDEAIISQYVVAERQGEVTRTSNKYNRSHEEYATRLLSDGKKKGWL